MGGDGNAHFNFMLHKYQWAKIKEELVFVEMKGTALDGKPPPQLLHDY